MYTITLMPGDGIGPEVCQSAVEVFKALRIPVEWDVQQVGLCAFESDGQALPEAALKSFERTELALKGPTTTPIGTGHRSINVMLRKHYDLYANVRPVRSMKGISTPFSDRAIDLVVFRENTEDLYAGIEEQINADEAHAIKIITRKCSERIARSAFEYAAKHGQKTITVVHKANIMKLTDGLFLDSVRTVAAGFPDIAVNEVIVDNMCMQLVTKPEQFQIILTENLYGDILSDLCAGLVGGLGMVPGANIGTNSAIFEAVHGSAPDIAGQNKANPCAMLLTAAMMLDHMGERPYGDVIRTAVAAVVAEGQVLTADLGGQASTTAMTQAIINKCLTLTTPN